MSTKLNRPERHESAAASEPPSGLSIFANIDYNRKGSSLEKVCDADLLRMRD